jgi:hypothetical protein
MSGERMCKACALQHSQKRPARAAGLVRTTCAVVVYRCFAVELELALCPAIPADPLSRALLVPCPLVPLPGLVLLLVPVPPTLEPAPCVVEPVPVLVGPLLPPAPHEPP